MTLPEDYGLQIYRYPLRPMTINMLNRQLRSGISDERLADLVLDLRAEDRMYCPHGAGRGVG